MSSVYLVLGSLAYLLMVSGLLLIRRRHLHWRLMGLAMVLDLVVVLSIQFQRNAIDLILRSDLNGFQKCHIFSSAGALILYIPVLITGFRKLNYFDKDQEIPLHRIFGLLAFAFRSAGFLFMFSMLK